LKPLVSVIMPVFNGEKYLSEAIESVLTQLYSPLELIVVDDGSTDGSASIVRSHEDVRYIYEPNKGVAVARNTGLTAARGEFIAFLDADDIWPPQKLQIQVEYLLDHPSVRYTISKIKNFIEPGCNIDSKILQSILENDQIGMATIVARKNIFDQIGYFNPCYQVGEDFEWFTRAKDAGISMVILPEVLLQRRIHNFNISLTQIQACKTNRLQAIKESLNRKKRIVNNESV
jgi:glycosyltransferase involved in cell wall biosynthesis